MGRFKITAKIITIIIVFIVVMAGITYHEVTFGQTSLESLYNNKPWSVWFLGTIASIVLMIEGVLVFSFQESLKGCFERNDKKNDIIKSQGEQIILMMENYAKRQDELMTKINENTKEDLKTVKRVDILEGKFDNHEQRIKKLESRKR